ncbi:MAG: RNA-binding protein [Candidatus Woesearchaeota archaeon]|nr:MAG: RNA-binding protein [Candidatus Woesearchaeota archaeon]
MQRKTLSKSEIKEFFSTVNISLPLTKKDVVVRYDDRITINEKSAFFQAENLWYPTLWLVSSYALSLPRVIVDKGAIRFVVNGADVMRPGIVAADEFMQEETVCIVDQDHGKKLGIGKALFSSKDLLALEKGKVVRTLHVVGDQFWNT